LLSRELNSIGRTLYYIYIGLKFEPQTFSLSILKIEFLSIKLF
jgi:hypothetical protein